MGKRPPKKPKHRKSLQDQIEDPKGQGVRVFPRSGSKRVREEQPENEAVAQKMSSRILKEARAQQDEMEAEMEQHSEPGHAAQLGRGALTAALQRIQDSDDEDEDEAHGFTDNESVWDMGEVEVSPEDERALQAFMAPGHEDYKQRNLGDVIMDKLREQRQTAAAADATDGAEQAGVADDEGAGALPEGLDGQVVEVYRGVGQLLSRYTAGKVPKAFKIIPNLRNWEEVLWLTAPESWSPHATYQATKMFVSNLNAKLAQRFLALVLLPRVRQDIRDNRRLHFALFQALKKATYKPGAFYKGLLLPLCQSRTCSLREAVIFSSVLKRASLPVLHSAAALLRLAEMEYCGTTSFFIRVLLDKKYALPYKVVDALVQHFMRFADDDRAMPVVWHQTLLCFVQRYRNEVREEDMGQLRELLKAQHHHLVTPEIARELDHGLARDKRDRTQQSVQSMETSVPVKQIGTLVSEDIRNLPPVLLMEED